MKKTIGGAIFCVLMGMIMACAQTRHFQEPAVNISSQRHPNLAAAQRLSRQAYDKIVEAQRINEWDLGGHAQKAKLLLEQVNDELKLAAEASNRNLR